MSTGSSALFWELSYAVTRMFSEASGPAPIPALLHLLLRRLQWDVATWWRVDDLRVVLACADVAVAPGFAAEKFETVSRARTFSYGEGLPGTVWKQKNVLWVPDVTLDENFPRAVVAKLDGIHSGVGLPATSERRVLGVVELFHREAKPPDPELVHFLLALGGQIGVFIEHMVTREALRGAEAQFELLAQAADEVIFTIDEESTILFVNPAVQAVFGYLPAELVGQKLTLVMPEYLRAVHERGIARYVATGHRHVNWSGVPLPGLHKDGHEIALTIAFAEFWRGNRRVFTGFCRAADVEARTTVREARHS